MSPPATRKRAGTVAGIAAAMNIDSIPLSTVEEPNAGLFLQAMQSVFLIFRKVVLPHLAVGLAIFLIVTCVTYFCLLSPLPAFFSLLGLLFCMAVYGAVTLGYSLLTAGVCALRKACVAWDEFLEQLFDKVKEKAVAKLDCMNDGLPKDQAKVVITGSVREVIAGFKPQSASALGRWLAAFVLGCIMLAMRSVLVSKVIRFSGQTIKLTKLFAGKATLVGAIFLNLRFFSTVLLFLLYAAGIALVAVNLFVVWGLA